MTIPIRPDMPIVSPLESSGGMPLGAPSGGPAFSDLLSNALSGVQGMQDQKDNLIGAFLRGEPVDTAQLMATVEESSLSLQMLVETRNKLTEAYRSIMNMQI